jgi:CRP/FNR family transcriptional regulator, cyclic AMP receptor protein
MTEQRIKVLQDTPIFGGVREDILELILAETTEVSIPDGEFLFEEDDPGDTMYVLEKGQVVILKLFDRIYYRLNYLNAGDCIGEMALIDLGRRSASVLAMTDCKVIAIKSQVLLKVYEKDLEQFALIQMNIGRELSRRLRVANEALYRELIKTKQIPQH